MPSCTPMVHVTGALWYVGYTYIVNIKETVWILQLIQLDPPYCSKLYTRGADSFWTILKNVSVCTSVIYSHAVRFTLVTRSWLPTKAHSKYSKRSLLFYLTFVFLAWSRRWKIFTSHNFLIWGSCQLTRLYVRTRVFRTKEQKVEDKVEGVFTVSPMNVVLCTTNTTVLRKTSLLVV